MEFRRKESDGLEINAEGGNISEVVGKDKASIQMVTTILDTQVTASSEGHEQIGVRDTQWTLDIMIIEERG